MRRESGTRARRRQLAQACLTLVLAAAPGCVVRNWSSFDSEDLRVEVGTVFQGDEGMVLESVEGRATGTRMLVGFKCYIFDDRNQAQRAQDDEVIRVYSCDCLATARPSLVLHQLLLRGAEDPHGHLALTLAGQFERGGEVRVFVSAPGWSQ
jgi:hypothetical protein